MSTDDAVEYTRSATTDKVPSTVIECLRIRLLDTLAAITAGHHLETTNVTRRFAVATLDGDDATVLNGAGDRLGLPGATLLNATAGNALDIDDGHRLVKGHPAAVVVPSALAAAEAANATIGDLLDAVLVGYELGVRAGLAIHETDGVYTGTGSWGALGSAAAVARIRNCTANEIAHALSIAEYHAPRTPIMRGVERPGMTKDGVGWGAYTGTTAVLLAEHGFTGSGTIFDDSTADRTATLGEQFHVEESYLKPYPCCRWAQPGVDAALQLRAQHNIQSDAIDVVRIHTFEEATHLKTCNPETPDHAEYSYPYPVAAALVRGRFTPDELTAQARADSRILKLAESVRLHRDIDLDSRFPEECLARVEIVTNTETYASGVIRPRGAQERPMSQKAVHEKARKLLAADFSEASINKIFDILNDPARPVSCLLEPWRA
jgi:2-methylcitrate dehydratase PrpD